MRGNLVKLSIPKDFCNLFQNEPHMCKTSLGCAHCAVFDDVHRKNASFCYSNALSKPTTCTSFQSGTLEFSNGVRCDLSQYHQRCDAHKTCGECLSQYPDIQDDTPIHNLCSWCAGCGSKGICVPRGSACAPHIGCSEDEPLVVQNVQKCSEMRCSMASDCQKCHDLELTGLNCRWTRERTGKHLPGYGPIYDWSCQPDLKKTGNDTTPSGDKTCPKKCHEITDCQSCLSSNGSEGMRYELDRIIAF